MSKNVGWDLDSIYKQGDFSNLYGKLLSEINRIPEIYRKLHPGMDENDFRKYILKSEELKTKLSKLSYRAHLELAVNKRSSSARKNRSRAQNLELIFNNKYRKISHWLRGCSFEDKDYLDKKSASRLFRTLPDLKYYLEYERNFAVNSLSLKEEDVISAKDAFGLRRLKDLRTMLETDFSFKIKPHASKRSINIDNQASLVSYIYSPYPEDRRNAYNALLEKYKYNIDKFYLIYESVVSDWNYERTLRKYPSPISVRNKDNDIPDKAVQTLLEVCSGRRKIFWKYFRLKAKLLGFERLSRYDIYAPVDKDIPGYSYDESLDIVLTVLRSFSNNFYKHAKNIISSCHIDPYPGADKQGGAFCATVSPDIVPYIMLNHTGSYRDLLTLAHELGHGIHSLYANSHSFSSQEANLPLCETASTLCETVLFEKLLEKTQDRDKKITMLMSKLSDSFATVLRQNYFVKFEIEAHKSIPGGISAEELSDIYMKNLKEQFGRSVKIDDIFRYEWAYIPHIVQSPFYCYSYNFGELLSLAIYARYKEQGDKFIPVIEDILAAGGSVSPVKLLKKKGLDVTDAGFWESSFTIIEAWVKELEILLKGE